MPRREERIRLLVQNSPLAGFRYHAAAELWRELRVGDRARARARAATIRTTRTRWRCAGAGTSSATCRGARTPRSPGAWTAARRCARASARLAEHPNPARRVELRGVRRVKSGAWKDSGELAISAHFAESAKLKLAAARAAGRAAGARHRAARRYAARRRQGARLRQRRLGGRRAAFRRRAGQPLRARAPAARRDRADHRHLDAHLDRQRLRLPAGVLQAAARASASAATRCSPSRPAATRRNVIDAMHAAHELGVRVVALTGNGGGKMAALVRDDDVHLCVPHKTHRPHPGSPPAMHPLPMRRNRYAALPALAAAAGRGRAAARVARQSSAPARSAPLPRSRTGAPPAPRSRTRASSRARRRASPSAFREQAHVNVTVFNRAVLLTGEAWDEATRDEIGKIAAAVPNVRTVTNEVQVSGLSSAGSRANDTTLTAKVRGRFLNVKEFSPLHVKVVTEAGVVYLLGLVTEAEAEAATELARTTSGVRKVVKVFDYCKSHRRALQAAAAAAAGQAREPKIRDVNPPAFEAQDPRPGGARALDRRAAAAAGVHQRRVRPPAPRPCHLPRARARARRRAAGGAQLRRLGAGASARARTGRSIRSPTGWRWSPRWSASTRSPGSTTTRPRR